MQNEWGQCNLLDRLGERRFKSKFIQCLILPFKFILQLLTTLLKSILCAPTQFTLIKVILPRDMVDVTWSSCRCPCSLQGSCTRWPLRISFNSNDSMIVWYELKITRMRSDTKELYGSGPPVLYLLYCLPPRPKMFHDNELTSGCSEALSSV